MLLHTQNLLLLFELHIESLLGPSECGITTRTNLQFGLLQTIQLVITRNADFRILPLCLRGNID